MTGPRLGPGRYSAPQSYASIKSYGVIQSNPKYPTSSFHNVPRSKPKKYDKYDVFLSANTSALEAAEKEAIEKRKSGSQSSYTDFRPHASQQFLENVLKDDVFHFHLKRMLTEGMTKEDESIQRSVHQAAKNAAEVRAVRGRLESTERMLKEEQEDEESNEIA